MTGPEFKAFNDFDMVDVHPDASTARRMLRRLEDIDNDATPGPRSADGRAALASSVVAHAVIELEAQLIELRKQLDLKG
jgi:hypothetical protein